MIDLILEADAVVARVFQRASDWVYERVGFESKAIWRSLVPVLLGLAVLQCRDRLAIGIYDGFGLVIISFSFSALPDSALQHPPAIVRVARIVNIVNLVIISLAVSLGALDMGWPHWAFRAGVTVLFYLVSCVTPPRSRRKDWRATWEKFKASWTWVPAPEAAT